MSGHLSARVGGVEIAQAVTTPGAQPPAGQPPLDSTYLTDATETRATQLHAMETLFIASVLGAVSVAALRRNLIARMHVGQLTASYAQQQIRHVFDAVDMSPISSVPYTAGKLGAGFAGITVPMTEVPALSSVPLPSAPNVQEVLNEARDRALTFMTEATLDTLKPEQSVLSATSALEGGVSRAEASIARYVEASAAAPVQAAAADAGHELLWVAERDACVICLAYSGYISTNGVFPGGLTFDPKRVAYGGDPLDGPPAHPHCRCCVWAVDSKIKWDPIAGSLRREAQRSVAKGWKLPSESNASRQRAASGLLSHPTLLPKSVIAEARKRLSSGNLGPGNVPTIH